MTMLLATQAPEPLPKEQIDLVRRTVANGATNDELALFLYDCQRRGIHPLDKLLHFTKRGGRYTPVTSIDFMRSQAAMTGEMAGSDDPSFHEELDERGRIDHKKPPIAATVTVYRITHGQRFAYTATARWSEYCPDNAPMWKRMPHTMLGKCAEALALRKAFPQQLAGLYAREEMDQAERDAPAKMVVEALTPVQRPDAVGDARALAGATGLSEPSVPNGADSGHVFVAKVESHPTANPNITKAEIVLSNGEVHKTGNGQIIALAEQLCQDHEPVEVMWGPRGGFQGVKRKVKSEPAAAPLVTADDIPF